MGIKHNANMWEIISEKDIKELLPFEFNVLEKAVASNSEIKNINGLATLLHFEDPIPKTVKDAYDNLCENFEGIISLPIELKHLGEDEDNEELPCEESGDYCWKLSKSAYELSKAGKLLVKVCPSFKTYATVYSVDKY